MKLIEVNNLKSWIENWFDKNKYYHPHSKSENMPKSELYDILEQIENVDAIPIKWIKDYIDFGVSDKLAQHDVRFVSKMIEDWEKENEISRC